jgi:hypothetical protein
MAFEPGTLSMGIDGELTRQRSKGLHHHRASIFSKKLSSQQTLDDENIFDSMPVNLNPFEKRSMKVNCN